MSFFGSDSPPFIQSQGTLPSLDFDRFTLPGDSLVGRDTWASVQTFVATPTAQGHAALDRGWWLGGSKLLFIYTRMSSLTDLSS